MFLKDYFPGIEKKFQKYFFSYISFDSSKIKKNFIFFAIKGNNHDGHDFINHAIKKGAKIIIHEKKFTGLKNEILFIYTKNIRKLLAEIAFRINFDKPKNLVSVTGTNGKSSIADFYFQILQLNKKKVASIGTLGIRTNKSFKSLSNTTIDPIKLSEILKNLKKQKIENVIMEASSHGLKQHRLDGLLFDIGIFTNLSHDHLDYHKNFKEYLNAKMYLFRKLLKKNGNIVTDYSIPEFKKIKKISKIKKLKLNLILSDKKNLGIKVVSHIFDGEKQIVILNYKKKILEFKVNLIGKIQIKNVLMAILAAEKSGIKISNIIKNLNYLKPINGRLEKIGQIKNNSKVILDYAHTPEALKTVLENLKEQFPNNKISIVFGCGGDRDIKKRSKMGKIANIYCNQIYITDDNPRNENPNLIRKEIKKEIKKKDLFEIADRKEAINRAIFNLKSSEILLIAGKGHETTQTYKNKVRFFSDREVIKVAIKNKNKDLSNNIKLNIIKEISKSKLSLKKINFNNAVINSRDVNRNDIFFTIKGKKNDAHRYLSEVFRRKASIAIVEKILKKSNYTKQIKVKDTLNFLTRCATTLRDSLETKFIAITGSCGKTSLKDMLGLVLNKHFKTTFSKKSFNNKYGVPLSLFNINQRDKFGVLEVGMDKKGEIDFLSKIIKPDVGMITNISFAHIKNFKNISEIAAAKGEIINNINKHGSIILNADDKFFDFHKKLAVKKNIKVFSFSFNKKNATVYIKKIIKQKNMFKIIFRINDLEKYFYIRRDFKSFLYNILATLTVIQIYFDVTKLNKNIFLNIKSTEGRGDISKVTLNKREIYLINESYNSNPLSLTSALQNFNKINVNDKKKHILLGDMLELGNHSKKLHISIAKEINKISVNKVHVIGNDIKETFKKIHKIKKGLILKNDSELNKLIVNNLRDGDYLMVKGSNSTGLFNHISKLKKINTYAL